MLNATLTQIATDLLSAESKVLMVGTDGGANFLYVAADRIAAVLGVKPSNFAVVPIGGFWPDWNGYYEGNALQQVITGQNDQKQFQVAGGNAWKFMGMEGAVNPACVAAVDPTGTNTSEHWKCLLAENAAQHIESRIFPLEQ